ncbi:hypothetical protein NMY22_g5297 [Coprinellus aureogranulatus]|nr:hypothetical protein NMY22_g5297 [Coprinellus aureogranulatus]
MRGRYLAVYPGIWDVSRFCPSFLRKIVALVPDRPLLSCGLTGDANHDLFRFLVPVSLSRYDTSPTGQLACAIRGTPVEGSSNFIHTIVTPFSME